MQYIKIFWNYLLNEDYLLRAKILVFLIFSVYLMYQLIFIIVPVIQGDGFEYVLVTESIFNHYSFDMRLEDLDSLRKNLINANVYNDWHKLFLDEWYRFIPDKSYMAHSIGYFNDLEGEKYPYHFFVFSIALLPVRCIIEICKGNIEYLIQISNGLFLLLTLLYLLFFARLPFVRVLFICLFLTYSSLYWYMSWSGPEVFSMCLVALAMTFYYEEKYYWGIFVAALAATQNPPIAVLVLFLCLRVLTKRGIYVRDLSFIFITAVPTVIPYLFYYYHFRVFNLIVAAGYFKENFISFTRTWGVFFDLNDGMILSIPVLIFIFIFVYIRKVFNGPNSWSYDLLILPVVVAMALIFVNQLLWNNSMMILRYATWSSVPLIFFTIMNVDFLTHTKVLFIAALIIQILNIYDVFGIFSVRDLEISGLKVNSNQAFMHNGLAEWVLSNYPSLYNPDPIIFGRRCMWGKMIDSTDSPICFYTKPSLGKPPQLKKAMVHISKVSSLPKEMYKKKEIHNLSFLNGWAYINF